MNNFVQIEQEQDITVIRLSNGVTNPINLDLVAGLSEAITRIRQDGSTRGLVLASANDKFFSIGFDIPALFGLARDDFTEFYRAFNRTCLDLYTLPKPTITAITGHATAGGCILALCCDYRYIAEGHKLMGLNELKLGVPVPFVADCILRQLIGQRNAREMIDTGAFYEPQAAQNFGLVDLALPVQAVVRDAVKKIGDIGVYPLEAFAAIKRNRTELVAAEVESRAEEKDHEFVDCWYSQQARERLKEAMRRF